MSVQWRKRNRKKEIEHVIEVTDQPNTGELYLEKKSAGEEWTDENTAYSLLHAEYSVYMVSGKNAPYKEENQVGIFTTEKMNAANTVIGIPEIRNSCGTGNAFRMISGEVVSIQADKSKHCFTGLPFGWYAVKEKRAPKITNWMRMCIIFVYPRIRWETRLMQPCSLQRKKWYIRENCH